MAYTGSKAGMALGTTISIGTGTPKIIGEVKSIKLTGNKWDTEDVTNLESTAKEFINALQDSGEYAIEGNRVAADEGQVAMEAAFASGAISDFTIQLPKAATQSTSGDKYTFKALVVERDFSFEAGKSIPFSAKLKVSGSITFTAGS